MYIIGGIYKHQRLVAPKSDKTRPTSSKLREALFNICQHYISETHFLDLFAGSGAIGLEALSRGAQTATFVDAERQAVNCIKKNAAHLKVEKQCDIFCSQITALLNLFSRHNRQFDIVYADPPYNTSLEVGGQTFLYSEYVIHYMDQSSLLVPGGILFVEEDVRFPPKITTKNLILKDSRKFGHSLLQIYTKAENNNP